MESLLSPFWVLIYGHISTYLALSAPFLQRVFITASQPWSLHIVFEQSYGLIDFSYIFAFVSSVLAWIEILNCWFILYSKLTYLEWAALYFQKNPKRTPYISIPNSLCSLRVDCLWLLPAHVQIARELLKWHIASLEWLFSSLSSDLWAIWVQVLSFSLFLKLLIQICVTSINICDNLGILDM